MFNTTALKLVKNYLATVNSVSLTNALAIYSSKGINLKKDYEGIKISSGNSLIHKMEIQVIL